MVLVEMLRDVSGGGPRVGVGLETSSCAEHAEMLS